MVNNTFNLIKSVLYYGIYNHKYWIYIHIKV